MSIINVSTIDQSIYPADEYRQYIRTACGANFAFPRSTNNLWNFDMLKFLEKGGQQGLCDSSLKEKTQSQIKEITIMKLRRLTFVRRIC